MVGHIIPSDSPLGQLMTVSAIRDAKTLEALACICSGIDLRRTTHQHKKDLRTAVATTVRNLYTRRMRPTRKELARFGVYIDPSMVLTL